MGFLLLGGLDNNLMAQVGGDPLQATGFAMGDLAIGLLLQSLDLVPKEITQSPAEVLVTVFDAGRFKESLKLSADLRQAGIRVICTPGPSKLPRQFKFADRMGISFVVVISPDEAANNQATIKDIRNGTQPTVSREVVVSEIKKSLDSHLPL